jgi:hypothetical protein
MGLEPASTHARTHASLSRYRCEATDQFFKLAGLVPAKATRRASLSGSYPTKPLMLGPSAWTRRMDVCGCLEHAAPQFHASQPACSQE